MGISSEPVWLGLYCACAIVTTFHLPLSSARKVAVLTILALALVFSEARASIIALGVAACAAVIANALTGAEPARRSQNRRVFIGFALVAVIAAVLIPSARNNVSHEIPDWLQ